MEEGERRVLQVVLNSSVAIEEILTLGDKLRGQTVASKTPSSRTPRRGR